MSNPDIIVQISLLANDGRYIRMGEAKVVGEFVLDQPGLARALLEKSIGGVLDQVFKEVYLPRVKRLKEVKREEKKKGEARPVRAVQKVRPKGGRGPRHRA